ncbi:MAG: hypothetical protein H6719_27860, partial [Sandaracinaceae bacterium]|nr:hypothetical protein [Sandaracinaceae bacterium]
MTAVRFRDPPPADERARALLQKIGEELLAARRLPAPLPGGSLSLLELHAEGPWLDLIVGPTDPVARVRVRSDRGEVLGLRHPRAARVRAVVEPLDAAAARHEGELEALAARLRTRLAADRWARAEADLAELAALPRGIPLTYLRQLIEGVEPVRGLLRTGFGCNQDC